MESFARTHVQAQSNNDVQGVYLSPSFTSPMLLLLEILTLVLEGSTQQTSQPNTPKNSKETVAYRLVACIDLSNLSRHFHRNHCKISRGTLFRYIVTIQLR